MKRKVRWSRIAILAVLLALLVAGVFALVRFLQPKDPERPDPTPTPSVQPSETPAESLQIDLMDYQLYRPEELDFSFAIARFRFKDDKAIDFALERLSTEEDVNLADVSTYVKRLEEKSYYLGRENVVYSVRSNESEALVSLFIPYRKSSGTLTITDSVSGKTFSLDLDREVQEVSGLKYKTGGEIKADEYVFYISDAYTSNMMTRDGEEYTTPATIKIYTFRIEARYIPATGAVISKAEFVPEGYEESFEALDGTYASARRGDQSVIGKTLLAGESGALFFEIFNPEEEGITYEGKILITLSDYPGTIEVATTLH